MEIPQYKPQMFGFSRSKNKKKYYRNSSSNFAKKARKFITERDGECCAICGATKNLTIDHIISVFYGFNNGISLADINKVDNLRVLCGICNSRKPPEAYIWQE